MGEHNMELLEQTVKHNVDDVREMKKKVEHIDRDVSDLKTNQQVSQQTMSHVTNTLNNLQGDFKTLNNKIDESNQRMYEDNIDQLKQYKTTVWSVGGAIVASIGGAVILFFLNI